jgi:hypothetical protein
MRVVFALLASAFVAAAQPQTAPAPPGPDVAVYQEIPAGSVDTKMAGTGYVLTLKCTPVSRTIHLWLNGALLYEMVPEDPLGAYRVDGRKLIARNFNLSDPRNGTCGNGPCTQFRVDYQTKDSGCSNK